MKVASCIGDIFFVLLCKASYCTSEHDSNLTNWLSEFLMVGQGVKYEIDSCFESQEIDGVNIDWQHSFTDNKNLYFATPHCLAKSYLYMGRTCIKGIFQESAKCWIAQTTPNKCPEGFTNKLGVCYKEYEKKMFEKATCPYNYQAPFIASKSCTKSRIWYPAKRDRTYGVGEIMHTYLSEKFGFSLEGLNFEFGKDCVTYFQERLEAVRCEEEHAFICAYNTLSDNKDHFCRRNKVNCIAASYNTSDHKCFCRRERLSEPCRLAEMVHPYQLSVTKITKDCIIGLVLNDTKLHWVSHKPLTYAFWSQDEVFTRDQKSNIAISKTGWKFVQEYDCKICEENYTSSKQPRLEVIFNNETFQVLPELPQYLAFLHGKNIFCFSDKFPDGLYRLWDMDNDYNSKSSGYYWCEGFALPHFDLVKSQRLLIITENLYTIEVVFKYEESEDPTSSSVAYGKYISQIEKSYGGVRNITVKWMKTLWVNEWLHTVRYLVHICTPLNTSKHLDDYWYLDSSIFRVLQNLNGFISSSELYSGEYCLENTTIVSGVLLTWNTVRKGVSTSPTDVCLTKQGLPVRRNCTYDFYSGARWSRFEDCRVVTGATSNITKELTEIVSSNASEVEKLGKLANISKRSENFEDIDIYLASKILESLRAPNLTQLSNVLSNIMSANQSVLNSSQELYNATDALLYDLDIKLSKLKITETDWYICSPNFLSFLFDPNKTRSNGVALLNTNNSYVMLPLVDERQIYLHANLVVAVYFPSLPGSKIVINFYLTNSLFNSRSTPATVNVGVLLQTQPKSPFYIAYKARIINKTACGFWYYGFRLKGKWVYENSPQFREGYQLCKVDHVTHFSLLVLDRRLNEDTTLLDLLTGLGFGLSMFGYTAIFATAALFKTWRNNKGNRILINYSVVSFFQIVLFYISNYTYKHGSIEFCAVVGVMLHYTVISQLCWMLVFAFLQYKRYVQVLHKAHTWVMAKSYFVSYILPAFPVFGLLFLQETYTKSKVGLCYPVGKGFFYGVILPIMLVVSANVIVFLRITIEMLCIKKNVPNDDQLLYVRLRLVVLMYFMLGVTWGFGVAANVFEINIFIYIFCVTGTLQGFVLFIFFIVLNKNCRMMYSYIWRNRTCIKV